MAKTGFKGMLATVAAKVIASLVAGAIAGVWVGQATATDKESKGLYAEIVKVEPHGGGKEIGRDVRVYGTATASIAQGFELRYVVEGEDFWYVGERLRVIDNTWELRDSLGNERELGVFHLHVLFGKTSDFESWQATRRPGDDGIAQGPTQFGLYVMADRRVQRVQ